MAGGTVLFTGFPGFIGTRVVRALLAADPKLSVAAVVEPRMAARARDVAVRLDGQRIEVLEVDIGERGLGIAADRLDSLRSEVTIAYHLAAIYDLAVPLDTAQRVNVDGTGNVLEVCAGCKKLERLNYVSTAYVAGDRKGVVYEHELALGQGFKNHYESTKFQAELWVRDAMDDVPVTVYRPAIATIFGHGFYGKRTACGQILHAGTLGVANRRLKCGTKVSISSPRNTMESTR